MPSDEPSRPYNWRPKSLAKLELINLIDTDGNNPIYSTEGIFLGVDNLGLQGYPIVMYEADYIDGMSHDIALNLDLGLLGFKSPDAYGTFIDSYVTLRERPDWDGYLTLKEANEWYREGKGRKLFTDLNKLDLSGLISLGDKHVKDKKIVNLFLVSLNDDDKLVYGNITLVRYPHNTVHAYSDTYDFDMKNWRDVSNWPRNIATLIGAKVAGSGQPYEIIIYGEKKLAVLFPWQKNQ